jgi:hypothetical protein
MKHANESAVDAEVVEAEVVEAEAGTEAPKERTVKIVIGADGQMTIITEGQFRFGELMQIGHSLAATSFNNLEKQLIDFVTSAQGNKPSTN